MSEKYALRPRSLRQQQMPAAPDRAHPPVPVVPAPPAVPAVTAVASAIPLAAAAAPGGGIGGGAASPGSRPKQKPAPLSKYRRKTANARERSRMREINVAFETLRRAVPHMAAGVGPGGGGGGGGGGGAAACASEKLTKITTLRLAMRYIAALSQAVREAQRDVHHPPHQRESVLPASGPGLEPHHQEPMNGLFTQPLLPAYSPCGPCGPGAPLSSHPPSLHGQTQFADPDLLGGDLFSDTPLADLVDPCLTAVALTSDDFYDTPFVTDFS